MKKNKLFKIKWYSIIDHCWYYATGTTEEIDCFLDMFSTTIKWRMI